MKNVRICDIISTKFTQFKTDKGASGHPAVVIEVFDDSVNVVIITDARNIKRKFKSVNLPNSTYGLYKDSIAICNKVGNIKLSEIDNVIGRISKNKLKEILKCLNEFGGYKNRFEWAEDMLWH